MGISIKYVVTDPCYILDNDVWSKCCEVFDKYKDDEFMYQRFDEAVSKALVEYTGYPAFACGTGFGDWSNQLSGIGVIKPDFFADAGMVCVCRLTSKMLQHWKEEYGTQDFSGIAIFLVDLINRAIETIIFRLSENITSKVSLHFINNA